MDKEFLQWLEHEVQEAWLDERHAASDADDKDHHIRAKTKWLTLTAVQAEIKDALYKEAME